mmetsp:Transcript_1519/g.3455  ORF Transcript_1519/g.3455 Transcript_1519/m.3455 type:complete len:221 (-) Transcript_1519:351-1013(-)
MTRRRRRRPRSSRRWQVRATLAEARPRRRPRRRRVPPLRRVRRGKRWTPSPRHSIARRPPSPRPTGSRRPIQRRPSPRRYPPRRWRRRLRRSPFLSAPTADPRIKKRPMAPPTGSSTQCAACTCSSRRSTAAARSSPTEPAERLCVRLRLASGQASGSSGTCSPPRLRAPQCRAALRLDCALTHPPPMHRPSSTFLKTPLREMSRRSRGGRVLHMRAARR